MHDKPPRNLQLRLRAVWAWLWGNRPPPEWELIHDHIRLRQHQMRPVARIGVRIGARHVKNAGTTEGGEMVGGSSSSGEFSLVGDRPK